MIENNHVHSLFTKEFFKERLGNISSEEIDFLVRITNEKNDAEIKGLKQALGVAIKILLNYSLGTNARNFDPRPATKGLETITALTGL